MDRCQHCQYYDRNPSSGPGGKAPDAGLCRRHGPSLSPINPKTYLIEGVWPTVRDEDWCGEFKLVARRAEAPRADVLINALVGSGSPALTSSLPRVGGAAGAPTSIGALRGNGDD